MINIRNSDNPWRNAPVGLTPESVIDPFSVLDWFFYPGDSLPEYRKWLERYMISAIKKKNKWNRNKLVRCIYRFRQIAALLDALWLIYEREDYAKYKEFTAKRGGIDQPYQRRSNKLYEVIERSPYDEDSFSLLKITIAEEQDPFSVIAKFFKFNDLFDAKEKLGAWCHTAIANSWEYEVMDKPQLFEYYEQVLRIIEAVFVIVEVRFLMVEDDII